MKERGDEETWRPTIEKLVWSLFELAYMIPTHMIGPLLLASVSVQSRNRLGLHLCFSRMFSEETVTLENTHLVGQIQAACIGFL